MNCNHYRDRTALICGLGLLGGSLALKLRQNGFQQVTAFGRNPDRLQQALQLNLIDRGYTEIEPAVRSADVIIICTPVGIIPQIAAQMVPYLKPEVFITDIGSTKEWVCKNMQRVLGPMKSRFLGSHPMAGSEKSGFEYANAELFNRATVVITPSGVESEDTVDFFTGFWEDTGAKIQVLDPATHDAITAATSHLPHAAAFAMAYYLSGRPEAGQNFLGIYGKGLLDTLRIAASDPVMWEDIIKTNRKQIADGLAEYRSTLGVLENWIRTGQFDRLVELMQTSGEICAQLQKK